MHLFQADIEVLKKKLIVPDGFWETWEKKRKDCNGCGSTYSHYVVPNTVYGLNIRIACCIHDEDCERGGTEEDKRRIDNNLHDNIEIIIDAYDKWYYPTTAAKVRADTYRFVVNVAGKSAFNYTKGENK